MESPGLSRPAVPSSQGPSAVAATPMASSVTACPAVGVDRVTRPDVSCPDGPGRPGLVLTIPNVISAIRLAGVPTFCYLVLGPHADGAAIVVLMIAGASDYLDGRLARALGQESRLGALLDPLADRLYIAATLLAFTIRGVCPVWLTATLVGRDVFLVALLPVLIRLGYGLLPVHYLGKAATLNLLYAFPLLLLGAGDGVLATVTRPVAWAFTLWGTGLYWWAGVLYAVQVRQLARTARDGAGTLIGEGGA